jgi:ubiquinone/menaquinone biosynthesis C-methylase UbiE
MSWIVDQAHLRSQQYRDASNLNARMRLHALFSTNTYGWFPWVMDQIDLPPCCDILELGCGQGDLWRNNAGRIPEGWQITLSDFSPGMLQQAQQNLAPLPHPFLFAIIDATAIPLADGAMNAVIANHMLYHVPNRPRTLAEIRRVLKPGGRLFASTIGGEHLRELDTLEKRFDPTIDDINTPSTRSFTLENGAQQLTPWFSDISMSRYPDALLVTQVAPLVDYVLSTVKMDQQRREELAEFLAQEMKAQGGAFYIGKDSGIFRARV